MSLLFYKSKFLIKVLEKNQNFNKILNLIFFIGETY